MENNLTIAFNILYAKKEKICPAYASKHNSKRKKHVIFLMIWIGEGRHYLAPLLREKNNGHFYCLNYARSFRIKNKFE